MLPRREFRRDQFEDLVSVGDLVQRESSPLLLVAEGNGKPWGDFIPIFRCFDGLEPAVELRAAHRATDPLWLERSNVDRMQAYDFKPYSYGLSRCFSEGVKFAVMS